jgi:hypothetical protein
LRAAFTSTGGNSVFMRTVEFFSPEDWSAVTQIKIDVWVENDKNNMGLKVELYDNTNTSRLQSSVSNIAGGAWTTVTFNVSPVGFQTAKVFLVMENMNTGDSACLSNFRLVRGSEEMWDTFETPSYNWQGGQDFTPWNAGKTEPITHQVTYANSAGAVCIPWTYSVGNQVAKMEATNLRCQNFVGVTKFRLWVYSTRANIPVYLAFWQGDQHGHPAAWLPLAPKTVVSANTWTQLEWDRPAGGFDWGDPDSFMIMVDTSSGGSGIMYADAMEFVK